MREVKAVKINAADFAPYGTFCSMTEPEDIHWRRFINSIGPHLRNLCWNNGIFTD